MDAMIIRFIAIFYSFITLINCAVLTNSPPNSNIVKQFRDKLSKAVKFRNQAVSAGFAQNFDDVVNQTSTLIDQLEADLKLQNKVIKSTSKNTNPLVAQLMQITSDNIEIISEMLDNLLLINSKDAIYDSIFAFKRLNPLPGQKASMISKTSSRKGRKSRKIAHSKKRQSLYEDIQPSELNNYGVVSSYQSISLPEEQYLN